MTRIALLGCGGFVGSHCLDAFLADPDLEVEGWDWTDAKIRPHLSHPRFTWMVSIARNRAIDIKRSRKHEVHFADPAEYVPEDADGRDSDLAAIAGHDADARRLKDCLQQLKLEQRNAVCLAYMNGLTHDEVAGALKAPLGTVKSWVRRGLESLKGCIGV